MYTTRGLSNKLKSIHVSTVIRSRPRFEKKIR